jgi:predicted site-specific integrase-resolvase
MKAKEVLKLLNISRVTLCKYMKEGLLKGVKTPTGQWVYDEDSVYAFIGLKKKRNNKKVISYSRVSTQNQKSQLKDQTQRIYNSCISKGLSLDEQIEDIKSGMSFDRKGFRHLCEEVIRGNVELIVIENKDRLIRFGFEIFEGLFKYFGTKILVLSDEVSNKTYEQELSDDLIAIIHYFSMKSYSHRRKLNKIRKELEEDLNK